MKTITILIAIGLFVIAAMILFGLAKSFRDRRQRGAVLLDAGCHPASRRHSLLTVTICALLGLGGVVELFRAVTPLAIALSAAGFLGVFAAVLNAQGRVLCCQNGIWLFADLIRWDQLDGYRLNDDGALILRLKRPESSPIELPPTPLPTTNRDRLRTMLEERIHSPGCE